MSEGMFDPDLLEPGSNGHSASASGDDNLNKFLEDALGSVLRSAKDSAAEMMDRAKRATEEQAEQTRRLHLDALREIDRMTAWRAQVEPLVQAANEKAELIRRAVADVPGRVADALAPVNEALADMDDVMASLTGALQPPAGGPSGSGGPNGGSRSFGSLDGGVPTIEPVPEHVAVSHDHDEVAQVEEPAAQASASDDDHLVEDEGSTIEAEATATAEAPSASVSDGADHDAADAEDAEATSADQGASEAAATSDEPSSSVSTPRWVDWPSNDDRGTTASPSATADDHEMSDTAPTSADEDEEALMSTTTQLRRAVTDIDWHDLPSASNG